jgi:TolB-like protein/Tfp pilus assembly protein PilF
MADETLQASSRAHLFLSYARPDRARAEKLIAALEKHGYELWWDARLEGGSTFADSIADALKKADAVLVLWSQSSITSDWVRDEAAVGRDRRRLVPLSLDGVEPPLGFRQYHAIDVSHWRGRSDCPETRAIDRAVDAILAGRPQPEQPSRPVSRRTLLIAGGGVGAVAAAGGTIVMYRNGWLGGVSSDTSIAVLPFKNLGGDLAQAYLSDGITEEIRTALKRIPTLRVLGSISSRLAAEDGGGAKSIAQRLDVKYLLDGSVQRAGEMLRVSADLTDGRTGFSKWSNQLDRPMADIFAVQREIAQMVAGAMEARIATAKPEGGGTVNVVAYENYLRGREKYFNSTGEADNRAALALLDIAVAADPNFAKAHALRSRCLNFLAATLTSPSEAKPYFDQATEAAQKALKLAPDLSDAHLAVGNALSGRLNLRGSLPYYKRALELAPGDADILKAYAGKMSQFGETGVARQAATKAALLDPLNHLSFARLGDIEFDANQYRTAIGHYEKALSLNPEAGFSRSRLAICHLLLGETEVALKAAEKEPREYVRLAALAIVRRKLGDEAGAIRDFQALKDLGQVAYQEAQVLVQWGNKEAAVEALERAVRVGDQGVLWAKTDPLLIPLRGNPRFTAVLKQVGLV